MRRELETAMNYLYDETFEGFLTCVWHHYYTERADGIFPERAYQLDLLRYAETVGTDVEKAEKVFRAVKQKISAWDAERIYRVHCTNEPEKEMKMLRYIRLGFKEGGRIRLMHGAPVVLDVQKAEQRLGNEVHRLCGLIRFSAVRGSRGLLYAEVEPDNDVLEFLAPHFSDRFRCDPFVIHDKRRGKALLAAGGEWRIAPIEDDTVFIPTEEEETYRLLWKQYFRIMATKERANPKCQRRFLPTRYWKHLTEMQP
jgi:probable DNA metabolism protein